MFVWSFVKYFGNSLLFWLYPIVEPFAIIWNFIPDTSIFILWLAVDLIIAVSGAIMLFDIVVMSILAYFYITALPDWFILEVGGTTAVSVIYGLTGGSFDFNKLGTGAWLTTTTTTSTS